MGLTLSGCHLQSLHPQVCPRSPSLSVFQAPPTYPWYWDTWFLEGPYLQKQREKDHPHRRKSKSADSINQRIKSDHFYLKLLWGKMFHVDFSTSCRKKYVRLTTFLIFSCTSQGKILPCFLSTVYRVPHVNICEVRLFLHRADDHLPWHQPLTAVSGTVSLLSDGFVYFCRSSKGISTNFNLFHNQLKTPKHKPFIFISPDGRWSTTNI